MVTAPRNTLFFAALLLLGWQVLLATAQSSEEARLIAAISNPSVVSYELKSDVTLTRSLPAFAVPNSPSVRKFTLFSKKRVTISGAKKYSGFWTPVFDEVENRDGPLVDFTITNVNLVDFRKDNKPTPDGDAFQGTGAAVRIAGALKVSNSRISGNVAGSDGGALYVTQSRLELTNCEISNNQARNFAGAVAHRPSEDAVTTVKNCSFINNKANGQNGKNVFARGGAFFLEPLFGKLEAVFRNTVFRGNTATDGGALYGSLFLNKKPPLLFDSCTFDSNSVKSKTEDVGGAITAKYVDNLNFIKPVFKKNFVNKRRNDIYATWDSLSAITRVSGVARSGVVITKGPATRVIIVS